MYTRENNVPVEYYNNNVQSKENYEMPKKFKFAYVMTFYVVLSILLTLVGALVASNNRIVGGIVGMVLGVVISLILWFTYAKNHTEK